VCCRDKAVALIRKQPDDRATTLVRMILRQMGLELPRVILELTLGRIERVTNGNQNVLVGIVVAGLPVDDDLSPGNNDVQTYVKLLALPPAAMRQRHDHPAGRDAIVELLQLCDPFTNV